tara:strand:+ start:308 stop:415 length:108 start_codon:yes stop_codon:yes gene_type:complete
MNGYESLSLHLEVISDEKEHFLGTFRELFIFEIGL